MRFRSVGFLTVLAFFGLAGQGFAAPNTILSSGDVPSPLTADAGDCVATNLGNQAMTVTIQYRQNGVVNGGNTFVIPAGGNQQVWFGAGGNTVEAFPWGLQGCVITASDTHYLRGVLFWVDTAANVLRVDLMHQ